MEYVDIAVEFISSADGYLLAISGVFVALAAVAKLTKTKTDDKYVQIVIDGIAKVRNFISALTKKKTK